MKKVYVVGFDAMIMPLVKRFAREGVLPNFSRMMQRGATNEVIPSFPPWTPTNWATLITGADTGSHGVAGWYVKTPDGKQVSAFDSRAVKAETIFEVADRNGIRSVAFHYPATMPARVKDGYVVDGFGHPGRNSPYQVAPSRGYTTVAGVPDSDIISFQPAADGWTNVPISRGKPLAARIEVRKHAQESNAVVLWLLLLDNAGKGYDTIAVCAQPDGQSEICRASAGEWTKWVHIQVGGAKGMVRFKPLQISRDGSVVKLYRSQVTPLDGFTYPDELGKHLIDKFGPYLEHASHHTYTASIGDFATALEEADYQAQWIAKAGVHMMNQKGCRLFYCHWHWLDHVSHIHLSGIDPVSPLFSVDEMERHLHCLRQSYAAADRMIGTILSSIDEDTYVLAISDHGNAPDVRVIDIQRFLWQKGYLVLKDPSREGNRSTTWEDIDWQRTTAYQDPGMPSFNIWINAEPGSKRYREIQMDLVHDLRTWVDPVINRTPIALALSKEAAAIIGYWGDQVGDVIAVHESGYGWHPFTEAGQGHNEPVSDPVVVGQRIAAYTTSAFGADRGAHHGAQFPITRTEQSSVLAASILVGPDVKRGYTRPVNELGYLRMTGIVPTLCYLLGIRPPAQCQGAIAYDLFDS